jgi:hypothetical protein
MKRFLRLTIAGLVLAAVIAVASSQAAGNTKPYTANVRIESASDPSTFRLTLANDPKATQSLGSANFTLPANFTAANGTAAISNITPAGTFNVTVANNNVVQFRATSSSTALGKGASVYADVTVTIPSAAQCTTAAWTVEARQSNDFSGPPGNTMTLGPSDLTPLGSFRIDHIGTVDGAFFPTVLTNQRFPFTTTALDTCGFTKTDYTGAQLTFSFLTGAKFFKAGTNTQFDPPTAYGSVFSNGVANVDVLPVVTETPNSLTVTDPTTGITDPNGLTDPSNTFDVVDLACIDTTPMCQWQNSNKAITATTAPPSATGASIGIGFNDNLSGFFACGGRTKAIGGSIFNLSPHFLPAGQTTYQVTLVFTKQVSGNGPASGFVICLVHSMPTSALDWTVSPTPDCPSSTPTAADAPCVLDKRRISGGLLQVILFLDQNDPWGGVG